MNFRELKKELSQKDSNIRDFVCFLDKEDNPHLVAIRCIPNVIIEVISFNQMGETKERINFIVKLGTLKYIMTII